MASEHARHGGLLVRTILRQLVGFAGLVILIFAAIAMVHDVLADHGGPVETAAAWRGPIVVCLAVAGLAIVALAAGEVARRIAQPMEAMATTLQALAAGALEASNPEQRRLDEIGDIARAAETFRTQAVEFRRLAAQQAAEYRTADADRRQALNAMAETIERETSIVVAKLSQHARSVVGPGDVEGLLRTVREGVVRAVRSASSDVERRRWPRINLASNAGIQLDGHLVTTPIVDVSAGGIRVRSALPAAVGHRCRVRLPGVAPELPAEILAVSESETRLRFEIDEITRAVIHRMLADVSSKRASAA